MNRYEVTYREDGELLDVYIKAETIEEGLIAFITANRHSDVEVIGINLMATLEG